MNEQQPGPIEMTDEPGPIELAVVCHVSDVLIDRDTTPPGWETALPALDRLAAILDDRENVEQHFDAATELLRLLRDLHTGGTYLRELE